jgi:RNA polymerase-binding transcription factor DksA
MLPIDRERPQTVKCAKCEKELSKERLEAIPGTRLCVECASSDPSGGRRRFIEEP